MALTNNKMALSSHKYWIALLSRIAPSSQKCWIALSSHKYWIALNGMALSSQKCWILAPSSHNKIALNRHKYWIALSRIALSSHNRMAPSHYRMALTGIEISAFGYILRNP